MNDHALQSGRTKSLADKAAAILALAAIAALMLWDILGAAHEAGAL